LLPRLEREHESTLAVAIDGLRRDATGHATHERRLAGEEAEIGAAEARRNAEALALAHHDVGAGAAGRLEQRECDRIAARDRERAALVRDRVDRRRRFEQAEEVRMLV